MKKKPLIFTIVIIIILFTGLGIYRTITSSKTPTVTIVKPEKRLVVSTVSATGEVLSKNQASLSFSTSGTIEKVYVKEGDLVKKGQILAKLKTYTTSQTVQAAKDQRDIALRNKDLFLKQYENNKDLVGGEDEYEIRLRTLNEQISQATANYKATLGQLSNYYIKAPFDGTIIASNKKVGEVVTATQPIYQIADLDNLYFEAYIDQEDLEGLKIGQEAKITLDADTKHKLTATVYEISSYANPNDTFTVKLNFDENKKIKPLVGMTGDIQLTTGTSKGEVNSLAFDEYFRDLNNNYIWTIDNQNKLKKVNIELGIEGDVYTEIKTDISGYKIVLPLDTKSKLEDGLEVKISNK